MTDDPIPAWAVELTRQVTILNERLPTHVDWTERNIKDHETRLRDLERWRWMIAGVSATGGGALGSVIAQVVGSVG